MSLINTKGALRMPGTDPREFAKRHGIEVRAAGLPTPEPGEPMGGLNLEWCECCGMAIEFTPFARGALRGLTAECECGSKPGCVFGDSLEQIFSESGR